MSNTTNQDDFEEEVKPKKEVKKETKKETKKEAKTERPKAFVTKTSPQLGRLAATNIAWRINGIAFFPILGFAQAVGILVGNAQGAKRPDIARKVALRGLLATQVWMVFLAGIFVLLPNSS